MKKTIIALFALAGVAAAEDVTLTTGISVTKDGETQVVSALNEAGNDFVGTSALNAINVGSSFSNWSGSKNVSDITFNVTLKNLYNGSALAGAGSITLNSFAYLGNGNGWCEDEGRTITVSVDGQTKTAELEFIRSGAVLTITDLGFTVTEDSVLTVSLKPVSTMDTDNMALATADIYGKNGATVAWAGVQSEKEVANLGMTASWSYEAPLVKLNLTVLPATPEPATATLSLLALAGLASRRRRH